MVSKNSPVSEHVSVFNKSMLKSPIIYMFVVVV